MLMGNLPPKTNRLVAGSYLCGRKFLILSDFSRIQALFRYFMTASYYIKSIIYSGLLLWTYSYALGQGYSLQGTSQAIGNDCYQLTAPTSWQNGTIWYTQKLSIVSSFDLEFTLNFGDQDLEGADGMVFVLQNRGPDAIGEAGRGIGFEGFSPSLGVEFDSYQNTIQNDPAYDHIAVVRDGVLNHATPNNLAGPVQASATSPNFEDGADHLVRIRWIAPRVTLEVYFDCELRISTRINMKAIFGNEKEVYWGFTGATGGSASRQVACLRENIVVRDTFQVCEGEKVQLVGRNAIDEKYRWSPAALLDNATVRNPIARPTKSQFFTVEYRNFCNQLIRDSVYVQVDPLPVLDLGRDTVQCGTAPLRLHSDWLNPSLPTTYQWTTGDTSRAISVTSPGSYGLTIRSGKCTVSDTVRITFISLPQLPSTYQPASLCLLDQPLALRPVATGPGLSYTWPHSLETTPSVRVDQPGHYEVLVSSGPGCAVKESFVVMDDCLRTFWLPDAFTPNADGQNDQLVLFTSQELELRMWVYNRWGQVVFFTDSESTPWDGTYAGSECPPGAYVWRAEYRTKRRTEAPLLEKTGIVWLIR
jgi:gliding motility-associated-like protein